MLLSHRKRDFDLSIKKMLVHQENRVFVAAHV